MDTQRRVWLKQLGAGSAIVVAPGALLSDDSDSTFVQAMRTVVGDTQVKLDSRIELHVPLDAANGAVVPLGVESSVPGTLRIVLLIDSHEHAKVAELDTSSPIMAPRLSTHLQLQHAATITALVETKSGWHRNTARVQTLGVSC